MNDNKKFNGFAAYFRTRSVKAGTYSVLISLVAIAVVIALNVIVNKLPAKATKLDLSSTKLYNFTAATREIAKSVDEPVSIYVWASKNEADATLKEFLLRYADLNELITLRFVDPALNPTFLDAYDLGTQSDGSETALNMNSLIVESGKRYRVVDFWELFTYSAELQQQIYYYYMQYGQMPSDVPPDQFAAENAVSSAMDYVLTDVLPTVYLLTGHGEQTLNQNLQTLIGQNNITLKQLELLKTSAVPEDCDLLLIASPTSDLGAEELTRIRAYLENGGDLLLYTNPRYATMPNFSTLCESYGLKGVDGVVFETAGNAVMYPYYLNLILEQHTVTESLISGNRPVLAPIVHGVTAIDAYRSSLQMQPFLVTSSGSYLKAIDKVYSTQEYSMEKEADDLAGPFTVGMMVTEENNGTTSNFVWIANGAIVGSEAESYGNSELTINLLNYLCDREDSVSIQPINLSSEPLSITESESRFWMVLTTILLPLGVVVLGFAVWLKRRKR